MSNITVPIAGGGTIQAPSQQGSDRFKVLVIGDLHISDKHSGRHIDYFRDCVEFLGQITQTIRDEGVTHLFLTGDLIGRTTEKNLRSRDSLLYVMKTLQLWNVLTNGHVYSTRGNHDYAESLTDFEIFVSMGLLRRDKEVDIGSMRIHQIDYGDYTREVAVDMARYNVAIMHDNIQVEGITTWFKGGPDGVELASLKNLYGVKQVVGGHIHEPSPRLIETSIADKDISLFYLGCGPRPKWDAHLWDHCFGMLYTTDERETYTTQVRYNLRPVEEVFHLTYDDYSEEVVSDSESPMFNIEQLATILEELKSYNLVGESDYKTQIIQYGGIDKAAVDLALSYIDKAEGVLN